MKKLFTLIALGSVTLVSAGQQYQQQGNQQYYQNPNQNQQYYQQQGNQQYNQNSNQNQQYYQQQASQQGNSNQQYYQQGEQTYNQNRSYNQQQNNQPYNQDQQYDQSQGQQWGNDNNYAYQANAGQRSASDQEIYKKVQDTLGSGWFSKGFQNVSFDVNNGVVNLTGSVDTIENKNKIDDSVKKIDGVRQVNNQLVVAKETQGDNYSEAQLQDSEKKYPQDVASNAQDRQLNARIRAKLSSGWFSKGFESVVIRTTNGVVTINGVVDKADDVQKIVDQIKSVEGVRSVNAQLTVKNR